MLAVVVTKLLEAVVGKMHVVVLVLERVVVTGGSHISLLVDEKLILVSEECPNPQIKLSLLVKHGLLKVLLNDP
jgi:hypothetical protein